MSYQLNIALRYLVSKKAHHAVNIISIISMLGVVVTTAALICVLSVFNGFRGLIMGKLAQLDPQIAVTATTGKAIEQADSVLRVVKAMPDVAASVPVIEDNALAVFADYQMPVRLKGVPDDYNTLNAMDSLMVDGDWCLHDQVSPYAVVGVNPMYDLTVKKQKNLLLNRFDCYLEAGFGCDFYGPFFKFIPEIKFAYGLANIINKKRNDITNPDQLIFTNSIDKGKSKMIIITFYFE